MFGTDGIRGYPNSSPFTPEDLLQLAYSLTIFLKDREKTAPIGPVFMGRDTRKSGEMIESALVAGLTASGLDVILGGILPTPAISFLGKYYKSPLSIVLSASHNPSNYNGIKLLNQNGEKLSLQEEEKISRLVQQSLKSKVAPNQIGSIKKPLISPKEIYKKHINEKFSSLHLQGISVFLDSARGAFSQMASSIFQSLGATTHSFFDDPNGENINENCGAVHPEILAKLLQEKKGHIGFAFDGDGDRVIAIDENGNVRDGDFMMAILGEFYLQEDLLPGKTVVATSMSNLSLELALKNAGGKLVRTDVGDRFVYEKMKKSGFILGGEQSGHILLSQYGPTGDGLVSALELLMVMQKTGKSLLELSEKIQKYPQTICNIPVSKKLPFEKIPGLLETIQEVEETLKEQGRLVLRYSGTESLLRIMIEGMDLSLVKRSTEKLKKAIQEGLKKI